MSEDEAGGRLHLAALAACWAALALLVFLTPVLPMQDVPDHLAMVDLYRRVQAGDPALGALFETRPLSLAYGWFYGYALLLAPLTSLDVALRLYLVTYAGLWLLGLHLLLGRRAETRPFVFLATPLVFNGIFFLGFLNLLFVYPLAAIGLGLIVRDRGERWRAAALAALSLVILSAHAIGFVVWVILASGIIVSLREGPPLARLRATLPVAATLVLLPVVLLAARKTHMTGHELAWLPVLVNVDFLGQQAFPLTGLPGLILPLACVAGALSLARGLRHVPPGDRVTPTFVRVTLVSIAATLAAPFRLGILTYLNVRLIPFVALVALVAVGSAGARSRLHRNVVHAFAAALFAASAFAFASYSREVAPVLSLGTRGDAPLRLLSIVARPVPRCLRGVDANLRLAGLLTLRNGWIHAHVCDLGAGEMPLAFRQPLAAPNMYEPGEVTTRDLAPYDLVCVQGERQPIEAALTLLESKGEWRVYRAK